MQFEAKDVLESIATAVFLADVHLKIVYANNAAEQLFSMSRTKLRLFKISDLIEQDQKYILNILHKAVKPSFQGFVASDVQLNREIIPNTKIDLSIDLYTGSVKGIVVEMRSMDYQQKLIDDLQRRSQHLAARDLIRNLAHEIKNPLGGIRGAAQLLEMSNGQDINVSDYTKVIIEQADRLKSLVDRLLGPQRPNPMLLGNIHYVIEKVLSLESVDTSASGIHFEKDYDPSLPEIELDLDAMEQALINIVGNAAQALIESNTKKPVITIRTRAKSGAVLNGIKYKTSIAISIIDNGPGIPENIRETLFYPMVTTKKTGTGLGLSIAQNIIERHKGAIECESMKGHTIFTIMLPIIGKSTVKAA